MPKKERKAKANQLNRSSFMDDVVIIDGLEPIEADNRRNSMPGLHHYPGNEGNLNGLEQAEEEHKAKERQNNGPVRDQNGLAPQLEAVEQQPLEAVEQQPPEAVEQQPQQAVEQQPPEAVEQQPQQEQGANYNPQIPIPNFEPQYDPKSNWSLGSKFGNATARIVGNTLVKGLSLPVAIAGLPFTGAIRYAAYRKVKKGQQNRDHRTIPGRDGEHFSSRKNSGKDILSDFRRIPTVWSYLTAGRATDDNGHPLPPKVSIYIAQPKTNSSESMYEGDIGHTMLGIEYTRYSKITGKDERYNIRYGFYPAGGTYATIPGSATMFRGAELPGQLVDDARHHYDISKTYSATDDQIERIAKASESYTDRHSYGLYTNNCTKFVRDMFQVGGIATNEIDTIFTREPVRFDAMTNWNIIFGNGLSHFFDTSMQKRIGNLSRANDYSYQGWGNKRMTKADYDRYKRTRNTAGYGVESYGSAHSGENLRRMIDDGGQLGSLRYLPDSLKINPTDTAANIVYTDLRQLSFAISSAVEAFREKIDQLLTYEQQVALGDEFEMWKNETVGYGDEFCTLGSIISRKLSEIPKEKREKTPSYSLVEPDTVKFTYETISAQIASLSNWYQKLFRGDSRLNKEVMDVLSLQTMGLQVLNYMYSMQEKSSGTEELGRMREKMLISSYTVKVGNDEVEMTPSHYESYLQIYKTPEAAVKAYKRLVKLQKEKREQGGELENKTEKAEFDSLNRKEELAQQFDQSHREMLNKNSFTQGDIDYAFRLRRMERSGKVKAGGDMHAGKETSSQTYMALFFDKIFNGIKNTAQAVPKSGGMPDGQDIGPAAKWLNDYLEEKTQAKENGMKMILRGILRAYDVPKADQIKESFHYFLLHAYLKKVFPAGEDGKDKLQVFGSRLEEIYLVIHNNRKMSFTKDIDRLIKEVMADEKKKKKK